jgi:hypothetical protein
MERSSGLRVVELEGTGWRVREYGCERAGKPSSVRRVGAVSAAARL